MILCGDAVEMMKRVESETVDACVTDPPYGISFMAKHWDYDVPSVELWREVLRVMKPGAHLLSFGGTRTYHRMVAAIEDAGFEIRDCIQWVYGSGFPKSLDVSKAIDREAGVEREITQYEIEEYHADGNTPFDMRSSSSREKRQIPITDSAKQWQGWGTALKPAVELICLARKPISEKTIASNVLKYGTGGMNIDGSRVKFFDEMPSGSGNPSPNSAPAAIQPGRSGGNGGNITPSLGRWPANLILDGSEEVVKMFPQTQSGDLLLHHKRNGGMPPIGTFAIRDRTGEGEFIGDSGSAARFFYCAKASAYERNAGLAGFEKGEPPQSARSKPAEGRQSALGVTRQNHHPTVKPVTLMRYLMKLITPKGGIVLDPFAGSGTTGIACKIEGMDFILIEKESEYVEIGKARIKAWRKYVVMDELSETQNIAENQLKLIV